MKEGEGISQETYIHDPQTQTTVWGWSKERGMVRAGWWRGKGEGRAICNNVNNKK